MTAYKMMEILHESENNCKDMRLIKNLYSNQWSFVKVNYEKTDGIVNPSRSLAMVHIISDIQPVLGNFPGSP